MERKRVHYYLCDAPELWVNSCVFIHKAQSDSKTVADFFKPRFQHLTEMFPTAKKLFSYSNKKNLTTRTFFGTRIFSCSKEKVLARRKKPFLRE